ncbi:MAG: tripartite tricarboxylate transporter TctB family protein [Betaproteobacteria bacterium]|nr:tripartite tricarboxylate transporter TctB family protein [Betaproteobacteria bacterium]
MLGRDGLAGLAVAAASLVLYWLTLGLQGNPLVPIGPGFYPRLVLGLTAALGLALAASDWLARRRAPRAPAAAGSAPNYLLVAAAFGVFFAYTLALPTLGFRVATFAFVAALNALLDPPRRARQWLRVVLLALGATVAAWLIFEHYLTVLLPRGRWTDF